MAFEIERKFLPTKLSDVAVEIIGLHPKLITQGYLTNGDFCVRVRVFDDDETGKLTLKKHISKGKCHEFEYDIPARDALEMLDMSEHIISKYRYEIVYGGFTFEVDFFVGRHDGIVLIEVELDDIDRDIVLPSWVGEEVTGNKSYSNEFMARAK